MGLDQNPPADRLDIRADVISVDPTNHNFKLYLVFCPQGRYAANGRGVGDIRNCNASVPKSQLVPSEPINLFLDGKMTTFSDGFPTTPQELVIQMYDADTSLYPFDKCTPLLYFIIS